jgi:hypothetical protein
MAAVALSVSILSIVLAAGTAYLQLLRGPKLSVIIGSQVYLAWGVKGRDGLELVTRLTITNGGARGTSLTRLTVTLINAQSAERVVLPWRHFVNYDGRNWRYQKQADILMVPAGKPSTHTIMFVSKPTPVPPGSYLIEISLRRGGKPEEIIREGSQRIVQLSEEVMDSLPCRDANTGLVTGRKPVLID